MFVTFYVVHVDYTRDQIENCPKAVETRWELQAAAGARDKKWTRQYFLYFTIKLLDRKKSSDWICADSWGQNKWVRRGETLTGWDCRWRHANVRKPQCENACGRLNTLQNMAISTGHSQRADGSGWLHPADHKATAPAPVVDSCTHTHTHFAWAWWTFCMFLLQGEWFLNI